MTTEPKKGDRVRFFVEWIVYVVGTITHSDYDGSLYVDCGVNGCHQLPKHFKILENK